MAINLTAYVKVYYERIDASEEIDVNKSNKSKKFIICHYFR